METDPFKERTPVWLDCDPGHDDAVAILLAVHLPNVLLLGVSTSASNAPIEQTTINAARVLRACGAASETDAGTPLRVYNGVKKPLLRPARHDPDIHGSDGLGGVEGLPPVDDPHVGEFIASTTGPSDAIAAIRDAAMLCRSKGVDMTLVITGAQSNAALLILLHPELVGKGKGIGDIVFMGGSTGQGNRAPTAEFNVLLDPEAAGVVVDAECRVVMIGLNVTHTAIWHSDLQRFLADPESQPDSSTPRAVTPFRHTLVTLFDFFAASYRNVFGFERGPPIHDALCLVYVSRPELFESRRYRVDVEQRSSFCDGTTVVDFWGDRDKEFPDESKWGRDGKNVVVTEKLDVSECWRTVLRAIHKADLVSPCNGNVRRPVWVEPPDDVVHP